MIEAGVVMEAETSWWFSLQGTVPGDRDSSAFREQMMLQMIRWAEARGLGIGGGFEALSENRIEFAFGLEGEEPIQREEADELLEVINASARVYRVELSGHFRVPTPEENDESAFWEFMKRAFEKSRPN